MSRSVSAVIACALSAFAIAAPAQARDYQIDPEHTEVVVSWSHFGFSRPTAHAGGIEGVLRYDATRPAASSVTLRVPVESLTSHVPKLDEMLRGPEFFDAATYPYIRFESTSVRDQGDGRLRIEGVLRIKNHEQPVVLEAVRNREGTHPRAGRPAVGFDATATLKRGDFGVGAYAPDVSDDVELRITVEALAAAAP